MPQPAEASAAAAEQAMMMQGGLMQGGLMQGGLMQGGGFYNRHAWVQAAGIATALPALARAAASVPVAPPLVIADYGSSQGRNSLAPMQTAISGLRARAPDAPVTVVHTDQPGNDFSSLFGLLDAAPESYLNTHAQTYAAAVGRSFFDAILPPGSVTLGWSSFAVMWLTRVPPAAAGHVQAMLAPPAVLALLREQGDADWRRFLAARADELRPGGRLVVLAAGPPAAGFSGAPPLMRAAAAALRQFVTDGRLSEAAGARAFIPTLPRTAGQLRAPFGDGPFRGLALEEQDELPSCPDAAWDRYCQDGDPAALADAYLGFFKSTFQPSLMHSLGPFPSGAAAQAVAAHLEAAIGEAIRATPQPCATFALHRLTLRRL